MRLRMLAMTQLRSRMLRYLVPAQIEAVAQTQVLRILDVARDLDRLGRRRLSTTMASMAISISPVGMFRLIVSALRLTTRPVTGMTLSGRTPSATLNSGPEMSMTHWVRP